MTDFDDLENLSDLAPSTGKAPKNRQLFTEPCAKCRGTGRFTSYAGRSVGPCFECKGTGKHTFSTPTSTRLKAKVSSEARKAQKIAENRAAVAAALPAEWAWVMLRYTDANFAFPGALYEAAGKYGSWTENQLAAIRRLMVRDEEKDQAKAIKVQAAEARSTEVDVSRIVVLFKTAQENGLKRPKLRVGEIVLSLAPSAGKNADHIYAVKNPGKVYLGKISPAGRFSPVASATAEDIATVVATAQNPLEQAVAFGQKTGTCSCCGLTLTNAESIRLGIGPICRGKWGL